MLYYSLHQQSPKVNFRTATVQGQAPDKGLYFPEQIPLLSRQFISSISSTSREAICMQIMQPYIADTIDKNSLEQILAETIDFDFPLKQISEHIYSLELFHGPTLAFKDVGARFMSRCLGYFSKNQTKKITVLVATSGDTGGAVANGFLGVPGVEVIILYPSGKVSAVQELQLTTCGNNITALEVSGSFDDCQAMVKDAFMDADLQQALQLTSANSINVARWLPQQLYYFFAYQQWQQATLPVISVPSGNFGNICAGLLANYSGLPFQHFIAACNANDTVAHFLKTGSFSPKKAVATISNAMDVGNPSNFIRILEMYQQQYKAITDKVTGYTITDAATIETIIAVYEKYKYILDPHGAVAYAALEKYIEKYPNRKGIILETAHPIKFPDTVEKAIGEKIEVPNSAKHLFSLEKKSIALPANFSALKEWLLYR